jgi:hypothetical protein
MVGLFEVLNTFRRFQTDAATSPAFHYETSKKYSPKIPGTTARKEMKYSGGADTWLKPSWLFCY